MIALKLKFNNGGILKQFNIPRIVELLPRIFLPKRQSELSSEIDDIL